MVELNWLTALLGGMLIGLSATIMLAWNGRIAGVSGAIHGLLSSNRPSDKIDDANNAWRWTFLVGLLIGGGIYEFLLAQTPTPVGTFTPITMLIGGFLVGFGTRMGNGCTSGHGVCGLGRLSTRSLVAVITFMTTAIITVAVIRHAL